MKSRYLAKPIRFLPPLVCREISHVLNMLGTAIIEVPQAALLLHGGALALFGPWLGLVPEALRMMIETD